MQLTKREIANKQLDAAIRMLFEGHDAVAIHTLVGAASNVFSDLVEHLNPSNSWDLKAQIANGMDPQAYYKVMRDTQNKLKHARTDPGGLVEVDLLETLAQIFFATMNNCELGGKITIEQSFFQWWYLAGFYWQMAFEKEQFAEPMRLFGDMTALPVPEKIKRGQQVRAKVYAS